MFYLRPRYYKYLYAEDCPDDWEIYAEEDDLLWEREQAQERLKKEMAKMKKLNKPSNGESLSMDGDGESVVSDRLESASNRSPSVTGDDDGDETEDDEGSEPAVKKLKIDGEA